MTITRIKPGPRMSQTVVHGNTVYTAGQVADDGGEDVAGQTRQVLAKIDGLLAEAGTDKSKLLKATMVFKTTEETKPPGKREVFPR